MRNVRRLGLWLVVAAILTTGCSLREVQAWFSVRGATISAPQASEIADKVNAQSRPGCDSNYSGFCVPNNQTAVRCAGMPGSGPEIGPVMVVGWDHFGLDPDGDRFACAASTPEPAATPSTPTPRAQPPSTPPPPITPPPSTAPPTTTPPAPPDYYVPEIFLPNRAVEFDPTRNRLLVSVDGYFPVLGNRLVEVDPLTGELGRSLALPGGPGAIAVSADGTRAYVGLTASPTVAEVDLVTFTLVRQFSLGSDSSGPRFAEDIAVQPGRADVIAVSMRNKCCSPRHEGVAIFEDGVARPVQTPGHTGADRIAWGDVPGVLYGYNNETTGFGFYSMIVTSTGVTAPAPIKLISGFGVDIEYSGGRVHATNGQVVDVAGPVLAGAYTTAGEIQVDSATDTTYILRGGTLTEHDADRMLLRSTRRVQDIEPHELVGDGAHLAAAGEISIMLLGPGATAAGYRLPPLPESIIPEGSVPAIDQTVQDLVASPDGRHLFGVVAQSATSHPGEVIEIDVDTAAISRSLFVGADPHRLAISDDGSTLMVGHYAANKMTQVRVSDMSVVRTVQLPSDQWANDIDAVPGAAGSFAVVVVNHCCSPALEGVLLVEDGVILPKKAPGHTGSTTIAFAGDPTRLYGFNGATTDFGFYVMSVDATGITVLSSTRTFISKFGLQLVAADGRLYGTDGSIIDPVAAIVVGSTAAGFQVAVPSLGRILTVSGDTILEFDDEGFTPVNAITFTGGSATEAVLVGNTVAIATANGRILLIPLGA